MRYILVLAAVLAAGPAMADYVARSGKDSVRLTEAPCPAAILALVSPEWQSVAQAGSATVNGKDYATCWALRSDGLVILQYEDGDMGGVPVGEFKLSPGV